jgi:hypothetical protein
MTCYFRHLNEVFAKAGIQVTKENKHDIDKVIHRLVGVEYKNCPAAWKAVKIRLTENSDVFISDLKKAWNARF